MKLKILMAYLKTWHKDRAEVLALAASSGSNSENMNILAESSYDNQQPDNINLRSEISPSLGHNVYSYDTFSESDFNS